MSDVYRPSIKRSWFNLSFNEATASADIYLYNDIGFFGVSANDFKEQLLSLNAKDLNVYINSMGGEVSDGMAIYNMLKRHNGKKTVHIDGMAASIASVIAMAGDEIVMPETALMYLHQPWTITAGNSQDLQRTAEQLQKTEATIVAAYSAKTGADAAFISQLLRDETTLTAQEAVELKFADKITKEEHATEFAYSGQMMNRVLCQMVKKKMIKEQNMADEIAPIEQPVVVEPVAEPAADPVVDQPVEPIAAAVVEQPAAVEAAPVVVDARAEFKQFVSRFGSARAAKYFEAGLSFADAERSYMSELEAENAELKSRINQSGVKPVAVKVSDKPEKKTLFNCK